MINWEARIARKIGKMHLDREINCQDNGFVEDFVINDREYILGIVADGCSEGKHSEVGAALACSFIRNETLRLLALGTIIEDIPKILYPALMRFLRLVAMEMVQDDQGSKIEFVQNYLLCTIVGAIMNDKKIVFFWAGDGTLIIDDEVIVLDQNNMPAYLAYHLLDRNLLSSPLDLPNCFEVAIRDLDDILKIAIATDGFEIARENEIWGLKGKTGLQRKFNVWYMRDKKYFDDDATLIVIEKKQA